jgi:hypothetical protein
MSKDDGQAHVIAMSTKVAKMETAIRADKTLDYSCTGTAIPNKEWYSTHNCATHRIWHGVCHWIPEILTRS